MTFGRVPIHVTIAKLVQHHGLLWNGEPAIADANAVAKAFEVDGEHQQEHQHRWRRWRNSARVRLGHFRLGGSRRHPVYALDVVLAIAHDAGICFDTAEWQQSIRPGTIIFFLIHCVSGSRHGIKQPAVI
jgi:hypothetical protein